MANPNGCVENLNPVRSEEEARLLGQKGGIASGVVRKQKKTFTEAIKWLVNSDIEIKDGKIKETFKQNGIDVTGLNPTQLATLGLWAGAVYGNAQNYKTLMEGNGELVEDTPTYNPAIEDVEQVVDNSNLEKVLYEANKLE